MKIPLKAILLVILIGLSPATLTAAQLEENPGLYTMIGDVLVARPLGLVIFAFGSVAFVATIPFSLIGGNSWDAAKTLVIEPGREVFIRCLGCRRVGRKEKIGN